MPSPRSARVTCCWVAASCFGLLAIGGAVAGRQALRPGLRTGAARIVLGPDARRRRPDGLPPAAPAEPDAADGSRTCLRGAARERARARLDDPIITFSPTFACRCPQALKVLLTATVVGLLTGFLGVGGGFLVVPVARARPRAVHGPRRRHLPGRHHLDLRCRARGARRPRRHPRLGPRCALTAASAARRAARCPARGPARDQLPGHRFHRSGRRGRPLHRRPRPTRPVLTPAERGAPHVSSREVQNLRQDHLGRLRPTRRAGQVLSPGGPVVRRASTQRPHRRLVQQAPRPLTATPAEVASGSPRSALCLNGVSLPLRRATPFRREHCPQLAEEACPSIIENTVGGVPCLMCNDAHVCRRSCGRSMSPATRVAIPARFTAGSSTRPRQLPERSGPPSAAVKSRSSDPFPPSAERARRRATPGPGSIGRSPHHARVSTASRCSPAASASDQTCRSSRAWNLSCAERLGRLGSFDPSSGIARDAPRPHS